MPRQEIGQIAKRLETRVSIDGNNIIIEQENPGRDEEDCVQIAIADADEFVALFQTAKNKIRAAQTGGSGGGSYLD